MNLSNDTVIQFIYVPADPKTKQQVLFFDTVEALRTSPILDESLNDWDGFELGEEFNIGAYETKVTAIDTTTHSNTSSIISYYMMPSAFVI